MPTIPVLVDQIAESHAGTLGVLDGPQVKEIETGKIRQSLASLTEEISGLFQDIQQVGHFQLKEVELQVAITAEGGVALIGLAKAGVTGTIKLKFAL